MNRKTNLRKKHIPLTITCLWAGIFGLIFVLMFRPGLIEKNKFPKGDDGSYVSHALTLALDFDMNYSNEPFAVWNKNHSMPSHGIGSGLLATPFVFFFSVFDRLTGHPVITDHNKVLGSWSLFGFIISASFYLMLGVFLFWKGLCTSKLFTAKLNLIILFCLSTGILFYVLRRATMSHAFEFFGGGLIFWSAIQIFENIYTRKKFIFWLVVCSLAVNTSLLIRYWSFHLFILPQTIVLTLYIVMPDTHNRLSSLNIFKCLGIISFALVVGYIPLTLFFKHYFNYIYPTVANVYNYDVYQIDSASILDAMVMIISSVKSFFLIGFGPEFGIVITNPILLTGPISLLAIVAISFKKKIRFECFLAFILMFAYFGYGFSVVVWSKNTGMGYGFRHLLSLFPLAFLGLCFLTNSNEKFNLWAGFDVPVKIVKFITVFLCVLSLISLLFFQSNKDLSTSRTKNVFGIIQGSSAPKYLPNLFEHVFKLKSWEGAGKSGYIGYLKMVIKRNHISDESLKHSRVVNSKYIVSDYKRSATFIQTNILFLFWVLSGLLFGRQILGVKKNIWTNLESTDSNVKLVLKK